MGITERRNCYGRNDFKKDRSGITYHIEGTASCRIDNFETVIWKLFLLLLALVVRVLLSLVGIAAHD